MPDEPLRGPALVDAVMAGFAPHIRKTIDPAQVAEIVASLDLDDPPAARAPRLRVRRVRFAGLKHLRGEDGETPFEYDQTFADGVNVLLVDRNSVGKSTVLKTIRWGLTGDRSAYDPNPKKWIRRAWVVFQLGEHTYTSLLTAEHDHVRGLLVPGEDVREFDEVAADAAWLFNEDEDAFKEKLKGFFFEHLHLAPLSFTYTPPGGDPRRVAISWETYCQALMPEPSNDYLLCDASHAMGNQQGMVLSMFLGLSLTPTITHVRTEATMASKEVKAAKEAAQQEEQAAAEVLKGLNEELRGARDAIKKIQADQRARRDAVEHSHPLRRLRQVRGRFVEIEAERARLSQEKQSLTARVQAARNRARTLREVAALKLHFTGIDVRRCPNCDTGVTDQKLLDERTDHTCRLCGTKARPAPELVDQLVYEANEHDKTAVRERAARMRVNRELTKLADEEPALHAEIARLEQANTLGQTYALPTAEEEAALEHHQQEVGRLLAAIKLATPATEERQKEIEERDAQRRILDKIRQLLAEESELRNQALLGRLSALVQETARAVGADAIGDVGCSPAGTVSVMLHDEKLTFDGIKNEGERMRFKLAFLLAMMRLGCEPGPGRHPGLLLVDQPGANEMIDQNADALAAAMRTIEDEMGDDVQLVVFTSRAPFANATVPEKLYGPQNKPWVF